MFGRMMVEPIVHGAPDSDAQTSVATLIKVAENVEIIRWMDFRTQYFVPAGAGDQQESGDVYVLDRKKVPDTRSISKTNNSARIA